MSANLEADVLPIHIAGGEGRVAPPPGVLAEGAPRRAARGRDTDLFFINLSLRGGAPVSPGRIEKLTRLGTQAFFATSGSVTAALRAAAATVNEHLLNGEPQSGDGGQALGSLMAAALRGGDLYLGQSGEGQAILVRPGMVTRLSSEEARRRPLGSRPAAQMQFRHLQLQPGDLIVLTTAEPPLWSDPSLAGLSGLGLPQALDRLVAASGRDLTGLLVRIPQPDEGRATLAAPDLPPASASPTARRRARAPASGPVAIPASGRERTTRIGLAARTLGQLSRLLSAPIRKIRGVALDALNSLGTLVLRMAPGLADSDRAGSFSPALLAFTAVAIPMLVVGIASLVYFRRGRSEQFDTYVAQAQSSVVAAQMKADPEQARPDWEMARSWLDLAETYRVTEASSALRTQIQAALDGYDLVVRLRFVPVISGGFGAAAEIGGLAATGTDLYVLDRGNQVVWHAWATGRGYEIDSQFECSLRSLGSQAGRNPVSIAIQEEPGALGVQGVVVVDRSGGLLYCAAGTSPLQGTLTPPDIGWGRLQAIDVLGNNLYVLDPVTNAVWIYDASDGLFSGSPELYFAEEVPDLENAIDLAMAQDELILLHEDGQIDRCRRSVENAPDGSLRIRVECETDPVFIDERLDRVSSRSLPGATPLQMVYSPPPEPSLFFLDSPDGRIFHYSMRLVYQGVILPLDPIEESLAALTEAPPNDLFVATSDQVYYAQLSR